MHSYVFQLSQNIVKREDWLTEDEVYENILGSLGSNAAESVEELSEDNRCMAITNLVCKWLPSELFETNGDGSFTYMGGLEEWIRSVYIPKIRLLASQIRPDKVFRLGVGSAYEVEKAIKNPLNLDSLFIMQANHHHSRAMRSGDFIEDYVSFLKPGDRIYVGAVFDYNF